MEREIVTVSNPIYGHCVQCGNPTITVDLKLPRWNHVFPICLSCLEKLVREAKDLRPKYVHPYTGVEMATLTGQPKKEGINET